MRESVVTRYLQSLKTDLDELNAAIEAGDVSLARRRAHQIAGASRMVGAHAVAERAARLEQAEEDQLRQLAAALAHSYGSRQRAARHRRNASEDAIGTRPLHRQSCSCKATSPKELP